MIVPLVFAVAAVAATFFHRVCGWLLIPILIASVTPVVAVVSQPNIYTLFLLGVTLFGWFHLYRHVWWLVLLGWRKETSELVSRLEVLLYRLQGRIGYAQLAGPLEPLTWPSGTEVAVLRTARGTGERLAALPGLQLTQGLPAKGEAHVVVDPGVRYQTFLGFGGAFTEASADLLLRLGRESQEKVIDAYFRPDTGLAYSFGRLHMNSCDFSDGNWSCCDTDGDFELTAFSIKRYHKSILPMVKRAALAAGKPLSLLASPWSPPAWMKDTGKMCKGGKLKPDCRAVWAQHYVRFAQALKDEGLPLWGFTVQNEPDGETPWENCLYGPDEERDFIRDHLGPALEKSGLDLKLIAWDHNRDNLLLRANVLYSDPDAARYIWGMGFHWYGDPRYEWWPDRAGQACFDNVRSVHELRPEKHLLVTETCQECGPHIGDWSVGERYAESIIRDLNNWTEAWIDWNLLLDTNGGYNHVGNHCSAPILADATKDVVLLNPSFFFLGHFSRYILPGAQRVLCSTNRDILDATAFVNPNGTLALVLLNKSSDNKEFCLCYAGTVVRTSAPAHSITTYLFPVNQQG